MQENRRVFQIVWTAIQVFWNTLNFELRTLNSVLWTLNSFFKSWLFSQSAWLKFWYSIISHSASMAGSPVRIKSDQDRVCSSFKIWLLGEWNWFQKLGSGETNSSRLPDVFWPKVPGRQNMTGITQVNLIHQEASCLLFFPSGWGAIYKNKECLIPSFSQFFGRNVNEWNRTLTIPSFS